MTKSVTLEYSDLNVPTSIVPGDVHIVLLSSDGQEVSHTHVPFGTPTVGISVPAGTGWMFRAVSNDSNGSPLPGTLPWFTNAFDVVETQVVSVVTGIALA